MSLKSQRPGGAQPLYGIDEISLPKNSVLIFSHPSVTKNGKPRPLYIYSGAMSISWAYALNVQSTPTIGGEVVQILSATAGPMSITGKTAGLATTQNGVRDPSTTSGWQNQGSQKPYTPNRELYEIVSWFREYMEHAGSNTFGNVRRDERAIRFKYPERAWDFYIQVTELSGFRYDKTVLSPQWSITAEIVTDNALDYFEGVTMSSFTDYLVSNISLLGNVGLSPFASSGTETSNAAFGNAGDFGSTDPFLNPQLSTSLTSAQQFGDNFQQLVASWASGNNSFLQGAFGAIADNSGNPSSVDAIYTKLFGSSFIGQPGSGAGSTTGSTALGVVAAAGYSTPADLAAAISVAFEANGVPGYVGVAAALQESGMNPDRTQDSCTSPNCGIGLFQVNGDGSGRDSSAAVIAAGKGRVYESTQGNIVSSYPASDQIAAAANWFSAEAQKEGIDFSTATPTQIGQFIANAQGSSDPNYVSEVMGKFAQAKQLIGDAALQAVSTAGLTNPFPSGWTPNRLDLGFDGTFAGQLLAPFDGTVTFASASFSNWGGYVQLKADGPITGLPTDTLYFAEGLKPADGIVAGTKVKVGTCICVPAPSPYGDSYGTTSDGSGQIEWGVAVSGTVGTPTNPLAESGIANPSQMVLAFSTWVQNVLKVQGPSQTDHAGYA